MNQNILLSLSRHNIPFKLPTRGLSMIPTVWPRMQLTITPYSTARPPIIGDICAFQLNDGRIIAHRITQLLPDGHIITQGDSIPHPDASTTPNHILGHATTLHIATLNINITTKIHSCYAKLLLATAPLSHIANHLLALTVKTIISLIHYVKP